MMQNRLKTIFKDGKFLTGFIIIMSILLLVIIYPLINPGDPLQMIGRSSFMKPGTYVSVHDTINVLRTYTIVLPDAAQNRIYNRISDDDKANISEYLIRVGVDENDIDVEDTFELLTLWWEHYDPEERVGTIAERRYFQRLDARIDNIFETDDIEIWAEDPETEEMVLVATVTDTDYANTSDIANTITLPLGSDNFGRDVLKQMVSAIANSLRIGLIAGSIATVIGLILGLVSGYVGGIVDDIIMFIVNLFTVIPGFVLLILIAYSVGQEHRGATTVAVVIGLTSWVWTTRSVRSQVLSLRNRDHVSMSKLSGHSLPRIILRDILPYIASYVVMAFILQVSSGILSEAALSMIGLGPSTTTQATLGLMMSWAMQFTAHLSGAWWAYYPVIIVIALISFSLNLMNTGLDQIFNPQLRES